MSMDENEGWVELGHEWESYALDTLRRKVNRLVWANRILAIAVAIAFAIIVTGT